jgi:hypothetical protein
MRSNPGSEGLRGGRIRTAGTAKGQRLMIDSVTQNCTYQLSRRSSHLRRRLDFPLQLCYSCSCDCSFSGVASWRSPALTENPRAIRAESWPSLYRDFCCDKIVLWAAKLFGWRIDCGAETWGRLDELQKTAGHHVSRICCRFTRRRI